MLPGALENSIIWGTKKSIMGDVKECNKLWQRHDYIIHAMINL